MSVNTTGRRTLHGAGEAVVTPKSINLIKENVHQSIGYIDISVPDNKGGISSYSDGTGFRVGDTYMMSAFHVFEGLIGCLIEQVIYHISKVTDEEKSELLETIKRQYGFSSDERQTSDFNETVAEILKKYLHDNANDTESFLNSLNGLIDTGLRQEIERHVADIWKNHCTVSFIQHGKFLVDWKILFGDKKLDVIIVRLLPSETNQAYPTAFMLDEKYRQHGDIQIIRYIDRDPKRIIIDQECDVFQSNEELRRSVEEAVDWWISNFPNYEENYFRSQYESCCTAKDEDTGCVILKASESFIPGSSGSPVTYLLNEEGIVIVQMIYQGGFPPFYYEPNLPSCFRQNAVPGMCFFGRGTTMKKLSQVMETFGKMELKRKLFTFQSIPGFRQNVTPDADEPNIHNPSQHQADIGESKLHELTRNGQIKLANLFLQHGASVNKVNNKGESVLHYVVLYDSEHKTELANTFIAANNGLVNFANVEHESLLHYTAKFESQRNVELAKIFTEKGAHVNCVNTEGESLLHYTTRYAHEYGIQLAELFLEYQAPVDIKNNYGESILHYTAKYSNKNNYHLATIFIGKEAPKSDNNKRESLLHYTVKYSAMNKHNLALLFIEQGISVNCCNSDGRYLLDYITDYLTDDDAQLADLLISNGIQL